jgi:hypothetical protein
MTTVSKEEVLARIASLVGRANIAGINGEGLVTLEHLAVFDEPETQTLTLNVDASSLLDRLSGNEAIIVDVFAERDRQDAQWGGEEHDDGHTAHDWLRYIGHQAQRAHDETLSDDRTQLVDPEHYRQRLVKIAALAFAAIASLDRLQGTPEPKRERKPEDRDFGKAEFLDLLDAALPESAVFRAFNVEYWGDRAEKDARGLDNVGRAHAALREYVGHLFGNVSASVGFDAMDHSLSINVGSR